MIEIRYQNDCNHKIWFLSKTALTSIWIRSTFAHLVYFGYIECVSIFGQSKTQFYFMKSCFLSNIKTHWTWVIWLNLFRCRKVGCERDVASTWSWLNCFDRMSDVHFSEDDQRLQQQKYWSLLDRHLFLRTLFLEAFLACWSDFWIKGHYHTCHPWIKLWEYFTTSQKRDSACKWLKPNERINCLLIRYC